MILKDREILRELGKRYAEIAGSPENAEHERRIRDIHALKLVRPSVWIDQIPWHELNSDNQLTLCCESDLARGIEGHFRRTLLQWEYFRGDMIVENSVGVYRSYSETPIGVTIKEDTVATDSKNAVVSHHFEDQLDTEEKVDAVTLPVLTVHPEKDREKLEVLGEVFDGILPVTLRGYPVQFRPWDDISRYRGVTNCLMDMADRPEFVHRMMRKFTDVFTAKYEQMEKLGLLDYTHFSLAAAPCLCDDIPAKDYSGGPARLKDMWIWCTAQLMVSASPEMNDEFNLQYLLPFMKRCNLVYYGCCEPLFNFIPYLKKIPNLRKIGATPWTKLRVQAEQMGSDYVLSRKPNPALVAGDINEEAIRKEINETIEVCRDTKTPFEYVLKDISTVRYKLQNLVEWTKIVTGEVNKYY
jgi:hypothetical protein